MKYTIGILCFFLLIITGTTLGQTVTTVPSDTGNDRFLQEYAAFSSIIRPGLSLNGFDNGGNDSKGLGLRQVLNKALLGDSYIKNKLNKIFEYARLNLSTSNPTNDQIQTNSRRTQHTAFEALASYVLEENGIFQPSGLNIRSHDIAVADLKSKLQFVSSGYVFLFMSNTNRRWTLTSFSKS